MGFDGRKPGDNPALDEIERLQSELDAERERADTLHKAQPYLYIGKNGKTILARNLEDQRDAALANVAKLREALERAREALIRISEKDTNADIVNGLEEGPCARIADKAIGAIADVLRETGVLDE